MIAPHHFVDGIMQLKCVAVVLTTHGHDNRESIIQRLSSIDNRETLLLGTYIWHMIRKYSRPLV